MIEPNKRNIIIMFGIYLVCLPLTWAIDSILWSLLLVCFSLCVYFSALVGNAIGPNVVHSPLKHKWVRYLLLPFGIVWKGYISILKYRRYFLTIESSGYPDELINRLKSYNMIVTDQRISGWNYDTGDVIIDITVYIDEKSLTKVLLTTQHKIKVTE